MVDEATGELGGFSLGFDFCAQHEAGFPVLSRALGLSQKDWPMGIEDRTATEVPAHLLFQEYARRSKDGRVKRTKPAAVLAVESSGWGSDAFFSDPAKYANTRDAAFYYDVLPKSDFYDPARDDVACSWSAHSGFVIHVQGEKNVELLKELHAAFQRKDIAYGAGYLRGFVRTGPALAIASRIAQETRDSVLADDKAALHLHEAVEACGIKETLTAAGLHWYALCPAWREGPDSELLLFLNPKDQKRYSHGWFTLDELRAWASGTGPVVDSVEIESLLKADDRDWGIHLLKGLREAGIKQRIFEKFVWLDDRKAEIGVRLTVTKDSEHLLPSGTYPLQVVEPYVKAGRALAQAERAARERGCSAVA